MAPAARHEHRRTRRVEFADTDMAGIIHFSAYFRYMEETEHDFLRAVGLSVSPRHGSEQHIGFPRRATRCEFVRPLRFEDEVDVHLRVRRLGGRSLTYQFLFELEGREVARGEVTASCVRLLPDGNIESTTLPEVIRERLCESPLPTLEFGVQRIKKEPPLAS
jgi:4-hydroxybenzoyl-CoA thioesterase/acyl-CoA thioester hydrolase